MPPRSPRLHRRRRLSPILKASCVLSKLVVLVTMGALLPGCFTAGRHAERTQSAPVAARNATRSQIHGRVLVDGLLPAKYFGVFVKAADAPLIGTATTFSGRNGAFSIDAPTGIWDVVVVGPQFERTIVRAVSVEKNRGTDIGTVAVKTGVTIVGRVRNPQGAGVESTVTLSLGRPMDLDPLSARLRGIYTTTTNDAGAFKLTGVAEADLKTGRMLRAQTLQNQASFPIDVSTTTRNDVELTVLPAGSLGGEVTGVANLKVPQFVLIQRKAARDYFLAQLDDSGHFETEGIPEGDYVVGYDGVFSASKPVHVTAGTRTEVVLEQ